ncbi:MAG: hypothetical protein OXI95_13490 [bacterium]|nr:hypothetical protein [bacterium]MDE0417929.1 hypothetical protein [bacterium]
MNDSVENFENRLRSDKDSDWACRQQVEFAGDRPCKWHVNDRREVFVVLGTVDVLSACDLHLSGRNRPLALCAPLRRGNDADQW